MKAVSFFQVATAQPNSGRAALKLPLVMPPDLSKGFLKQRGRRETYADLYIFPKHVCNVQPQDICMHSPNSQHPENVSLFSLQPIFQMMEDLKFLIFSFSLMKDFHFLNLLGSHRNSSRAL